MNFKDKCSIKIVNLPKEEPPHNVSPKVIISQFTWTLVSLVQQMGRDLLTIKQRNQITNSGLCRYVISVCKTSAIHMKIIISTTDNYYHRRRGTHLQSLITASYYYVFYVQQIFISQPKFFLHFDWFLPMIYQRKDTRLTSSLQRNDPENILEKSQSAVEQD